MASKDGSSTDDSVNRNGGEPHVLNHFTLGASSKFLSSPQKEALFATVSRLATPGKGITACDESAGTIGKRFAAVGVKNTEENRRQYRQMLFTAPGVENYLVGAILDPETLSQCSDDGRLFPKLLEAAGISVGVKPHLKVVTLPGTGGDTVMQGLDSLDARCREYYDAGARFAKWRSPLTIDVMNGRPTRIAIESNMNDLARFALICQNEGLVPMVEPDVVLDGAHTLEEAVDVNVRVQSALFKAMTDHGVYINGCILKTNMVNAGKDCPVGYTAVQIAVATMFVLEQSMPVAIKGVNFLSGGQSLSQAASRLAAINREAQRRSSPWNLSFSWSAALQLPLMDLCRSEGSEGQLRLSEMSRLYLEELQIACDSTKGVYKGSYTDGHHLVSSKGQF